MLRINRKNPFFIAIVIFLFLIIFNYLGLLKGAQNFVLLLGRPVAEKLYRSAATWSDIFSPNQEVDFWQEEARHWQKVATELTVVQANYREVLEENAQLKAALQFSQTHDVRFLTAAIIAKEDAGEDRRDLIINLGSRDGLRPGLGVVVDQGILVGKILETKERTARICLTTSPNCRVAAAIQNQAKTQGLTEGDLGLTIKMTFIPQLEQIQVGDLVVSSGLSGDIPRGLVIGRINQVRNEANEIWQEASIEPLVNFDHLSIVNILIP